jgi:hypothetical protein
LQWLNPTDWDRARQTVLLNLRNIRKRAAVVRAQQSNCDAILADAFAANVQEICSDCVALNGKRLAHEQPFTCLALARTDSTLVNHFPVSRM